MNVGLAGSGFSNFGWFGLNCPDTYVITPTSQPDYDKWGPDGCHWSAEDWIMFHKVLVADKGKEAADSIWASYYDKSTWGAAEISFSTNNPSFKTYMLNNGLQNKSSILSRIYKAETAIDALGQPIRNVGEIITNTTQAAANTAGAASQIAEWLPYIALAALTLIALLIWNKKSLNVAS